MKSNKIIYKYPFLRHCIILLPNLNSYIRPQQPQMAPRLATPTVTTTTTAQQQKPATTISATTTQSSAVSQVRITKFFLELTELNQKCLTLLDIFKQDPYF